MPSNITGYATNLLTYANNIHTYEGGTHEDGFKRALTRVLKVMELKVKLSKKKDRLSGEDTREGLTAIISIKHGDPQFEGQTKTKLGNSEVRQVVDKLFSEHFERFYERILLWVVLLLKRVLWHLERVLQQHVK